MTIGAVVPSTLTLVERSLSRAELEALRNDLVARMRANPALASAKERTFGSVASSSATPGDIDVTITVDAPLRDTTVRAAIEQEVTRFVADRLISGSELTVRHKETIWQLHLDLAVEGTDGKIVLRALTPRRDGEQWVISREAVVTFFP